MFNIFKKIKKNNVKNVVVIVDEDFYPKANNPHLEDVDSKWYDGTVLEYTKYSEFIKDKKKYYDFYTQLRNDYKKIKPSNRYHRELVSIFKDFNLEIINLGIDVNFERIGFKKVIHPKGINTQLICNPSTFGCGKRFKFDTFNEKTVCKNCKQKSHLKPNIDWFGESSDYREWQKAKLVCEEADMIIFIGKNCNRTIINTLLNLNPSCKKIEIAAHSSDVLETEFHYVIEASDNIIGLRKLKELLPIYIKDKTPSL